MERIWVPMGRPWHPMGGLWRPCGAHAEPMGAHGHSWEDPWGAHEHPLRAGQGGRGKGTLYQQTPDRRTSGRYVQFDITLMISRNNLPMLY